jgi:integrase/recombinase XerD
VFFGSETASVLRKWLTIRDSIKPTVKPTTIFIGQNGKKLKPRNVGRLIERIQTRAGLEDTKVCPHVLRHTSATLNVKNGMDVFSLRTQFGWENMETAMKYVHMSGSRLAEKMKDASPMDNLYDSYKRNNKRDERGRWVSS